MGNSPPTCTQVSLVWPALPASPPLPFTATASRHPAIKPVQRCNASIGPTMASLDVCFYRYQLVRISPILATAFIHEGSALCARRSLAVRHRGVSCRVTPTTSCVHSEPPKSLICVNLLHLLRWLVKEMRRLFQATREKCRHSLEQS